jgi:hypothetical protein
MITLCLLGAVVLLTYMLWVSENAVIAAEAKTDELRIALKKAFMNALDKQVELESARQVLDIESKKVKKPRGQKSAGRRAKP